MMHPDIPKLPFRLFRWFCKAEVFDELEGDLEEAFLLNRAQYGVKRARKIYAYEVFKMIRPSVIHRPKPGSLPQFALLASFLTISTRHLQHHKLFSFINIFSLSIAMSSGLLVMGMIHDLLQFDEFHERKQEIYRVVSTPYYQSRPFKTQATSPFDLGPEMLESIPGIQITQLGRWLSGNAIVGDKTMFAKGIYADEHFFDFLSFDLIQGREDLALSDPFSIVVSQAFAKKVFGEQNPIGRMIEMEGKGDFMITGMVADAPQFSHIQFDVIASLSTVRLLAGQGIINPSHDEWENLDQYYNYIFIPDNLELSSVKNWLKNNAQSYYHNPDSFTATFEIQPIHKIVPGPDISDSIGPKMIFLPVIILCIIAGAILLSAIFNYTNLSMARSLRRSKEVGIRKLNGANGSLVFVQFSVEAILLSMIALGFGLLLFAFLRNEFIQLLPRAEEMVSLRLTPSLIGWFLGFALVTGLIAGAGPSLFFFRLSSLAALRSGTVLRALSGLNFRKVLIVAQFTLTVIFVMAVLITYKQYAYSLNTDLGFEKANMLNVQLQKNDPELVKVEFMGMPEVSQVSFSSYLPGIGSRHNLRVVDPRNQDSVWVHTMSVNASYLENLSHEFVIGRNFVSGENTNREASIIVNEHFLSQFGLESPSEALDVTFLVEGNRVRIVGVVKDFVYSHLEEPIKSFVFRNTGNYEFANLKVSSSDVVNLLDKIEKAWNRVDSSHRLEAAFLDDQIEEHYHFLVDFMKIFGFIGFLAICISSLGLLGMVIYSIETRIKEIGIRKTFGASERKLIILLSRGFFKMVLWAMFIGSPICYFLFDQLILAQNAFRVEITFREIGGSLAIVLTICLMTIITQIVRAARTNPSVILRNE